MQADINKRTQPKTKKKKGYCARTGKSSLERIHIEFTHHMVNETKAALFLTETQNPRAFSGELLSSWVAPCTLLLHVVIYLQVQDKVQGELQR